MGTSLNVFRLFSRFGRLISGGSLVMIPAQRNMLRFTTTVLMFRGLSMQTQQESLTNGLPAGKVAEYSIAGLGA